MMIIPIIIYPLIIFDVQSPNPQIDASKSVQSPNHQPFISYIPITQRQTARPPRRKLHPARTLPADANAWPRNAEPHVSV